MGKKDKPTGEEKHYIAENTKLRQRNNVLQNEIMEVRTKNIELTDKIEAITKQMILVCGQLGFSQKEFEEMAALISDDYKNLQRTNKQLQDMVVEYQSWDSFKILASGNPRRTGHLTALMSMISSLADK